MTRLPRLTRPEGPLPAATIVHLGLGAFYRAFGAIYFAELMAQGGGDWGIVGVSLKRPDQQGKLGPQGGAYTAVELGPEGRSARVIASVQQVLVAPQSPEAVLKAMDAAKLVTLTVTEKGYCHLPATGRLNPEHPDIIADLARPEAPASAIGYLVRALARRRDAGRTPFTVLSCDNLPKNGRLLRGLVLDLAALIGPDLRAWIEAEVRFAGTMVDRIVPATTAADLALVAALTGCDDAAPVMHEPFRQWVIEDDFTPGTRPALERVGARMVADVTPFEHMKLRMLNGTHSALAYLGYLAGAETIADAVARPALAAFIRHLWAAEIIPALTAPPGTALPAYGEALFARYANPAIRHRTWQIAMDGSQKLPQRLLATLEENLQAGRRSKGILLVIAAWMTYTSGFKLDGTPIEVRDPLAPRLAEIWPGAPAKIVARYLAVAEVFRPELAARPGLAQALTAALERLLAIGPEAAAAEIAQ